VVITVKKHPIFTREGNDLYCEIPITLAQAVEGAELEVPILNGKVPIKIPAGTPSGKVFTLKGQGMPSLQGGARGDQKIKIRVEIPSWPSEREQEMGEHLHRLRKKGVRSQEEEILQSETKESLGG